LAQDGFAIEAVSGTTMRVVALTLLLCVSAGVSKESPVSNVVELIAGLKTKIQADGHAEQQVYDKYACWCESTTNKKNSAISDAEIRIDTLSANILKLNGKLGSFFAEIAKLKKDIASNKETMTQATEIRNTEHKDFTKTHADLEQAISNLNKAIEVINGGTSGFTPAMMETRMLTVAASVRGAMGMYSKHQNDEHFDHQKYGTIKSFLGAPASMVEITSPHKGTYTTQSGAISGILEEMYEQFQRDVISATSEENQRQTDFNNLESTKNTDFALLTDTLTKKTQENGHDAKQLADDKTERQETEAQVKTDKAFLETTTESCKTRADQWSERTRLRTEELAGINQAINILTSDDAQTTFTDSATTFVQLAEKNTYRMKAFNILKSVGDKTHSVRISLLAARTYTTAANHFGVVVEDVEKTIADLREEEAADTKHKDWCESERNAGNAKNEKLEYQKSELEAAIERLENHNIELTADITATETEMTDLKAEMQTALNNRNAEHEEFQVALKDDTDAVMLITKAMESLSAFYKNNDKEMVEEEDTDVSFAQVRKHKQPVRHEARSLLHHVKQPEYEEDSDVAPESFEDGADYGGRGSETSGIVSTLGGIKEDIEHEMKSAREEEGASDVAYRTQLAESTASMKAMENKVSTMNDNISENKKQIANHEKTHGNADAEKTATDGYLNELHNDCDWIEESYVPRREARKEEIAGLETAKKALSVSSVDPAALTATKAVVTKTDAQETQDTLDDLDNIEKGFSFLQKN